jgi:Flp pilus assembly protein TadD
LLADPVRLVRMDAARALADVPESQLAPGDGPRRAAALAEWVAAQRFNADRPESLTNLATLAMVTGRPDEAVADFEAAIALDPTYAPAVVNLADLYRATGREEQSEAALRAALARTPDAAAVHHALGLALVRQRRTGDALAALRRAAELSPDEPRFGYVYAIALHDTGDPGAATAALEAALTRHPNDRASLQALIAYQMEAGNRSRALALARRLETLEPDSPEVRRLREGLEREPPAP